MAETEWRKVQRVPMSVVPAHVKGPAPRGAYRAGYAFGRHGYGKDLRQGDGQDRPHYSAGLLRHWNAGREAGEREAAADQAGLDQSKIQDRKESIPPGAMRCPVCHGTGDRTPSIACRSCMGTGYIHTRESAAAMARTDETERRRDG